MFTAHTAQTRKDTKIDIPTRAILTKAELARGFRVSIARIDLLEGYIRTTARAR